MGSLLWMECDAKVNADDGEVFKVVEVTNKEEDMEFNATGE